VTDDIALVNTEEKKEKSIRLPIDAQRMEAWEKLLDEKQITQQAALLAMIDWVVAQDPLVQSMVLGQIPASDDLVRVALRRMAERQPTGQPYRRAAKPRE
jgi:hypothetical protein